MKFTFKRRIRFSETDAAGVVYFANFLSICHDTYEEALRAAGIELNALFREREIIIPIAHAECDYLRPLECGDEIEIEVVPERTKPDSFSVSYTLFRTAPARKAAAKARTDHVCLSATTRKRDPLPEEFSPFFS